MASTDAQLAPQKNAACRVTFALRLNNGAMNSGAAGLDSEISQDGGTFVDCTNEATEIAASSGVYYLDLTAAEMNADTIAIVVKSSTGNAVTQDIVMYPQSTPNYLAANIVQIAGSATAATRQSTLVGNTVAFQVDSSTYSPTTVDFETNNATNYATDFFKGRSLLFTSGNLQFQAARIVGSTYSGNNKVKLTVTALTAPPANASFCACI